MAFAMRNTTAQLAELIPDITIRTRAEVEAEEAEERKVVPPPARSNKRKKISEHCGD